MADSSVPANAKVRTLVQELAHALEVGYADYGRELAEVIVESAAVIVCGSIGLDTSGESVPYVAGWADGDASKIREYAEKVDECARRIEDAIGRGRVAAVRGRVVSAPPVRCEGCGRLVAPGAAWTVRGRGECCRTPLDRKTEPPKGKETDEVSGLRALAMGHV